MPNNFLSRFANLNKHKLSFYEAVHRGNDISIYALEISVIQEWNYTLSTYFYYHGLNLKTSGFSENRGHFSFPALCEEQLVLGTFS